MASPAPVSTYVFTKNISKFDAMHAYFRERQPKYLNFSAENDVVTLYLSAELTEAEQASMATLVAAYEDPEFWLTLERTEEQFLSTKFTSSTTPVVLQSFIVSPYNASDVLVMDSIKTVINFEVLDIQDLLTIPPETPFTITIELYNFTQSETVITEVKDIADKIQMWRDEASGLSEATSRSHWSTLQMFGLKDYVPGADNIWQFRVNVSYPLVRVALNSVQKLFYNVL